MRYFSLISERDIFSKLNARKALPTELFGLGFLFFNGLS